MMVFLDLQSRKVNSSLKIAILAAFCLLTPQTSLAQYGQPSLDAQQKRAQMQISQLHEQRLRSENGNEPLMMLNGLETGNNPPLARQIELERRFGKTISEGYGYRIGTEPSFPQIKFYKLEEPSTLSARVEALLHGVTVSLPPEYDMYGYELRRYMSGIAGAEAMGSKKRLVAEIANTKRAKIILEYWGKEINEYLDTIEAEIEADESIDSATRTTFKFNRGRVKAFLVESNSWVDNNQAMLEMLYQIWGLYEYKDPYINFRNKKELDRFAKLFRAREKSLKIIQEYPPFRMMIY